MSLPLGSESLTSLITVDISHNQVQFLDGLELCKHLRSLKANHNKLRSLPRQTKWKRLVELDLSFNQLLVRSYSRKGVHACKSSDT
jgi:Leucine-rich repeat (LRR) protein